jgi:hypothetical protein
MKKIVASVGLVALGVSGAYAAYAPGLSPMDTSKAWSVSATLRGFYDDNYATWSDGEKRDSFGFEVSPSVRFNLPLDQTYLGLRYIYSARYYEDRDRKLPDPNIPGRTEKNDPWDQTHQVDLILNHAFSERYTLNLMDSFVIAQEPELLAPTGNTSYPYRTEGDNLRNRANATFTAELTRLFSTVISYNNVLYDYDDKGGNALNPSLSGLLDRMEHTVSADLRWQALPETTALVGYRFGAVQYTSDELVGWHPLWPKNGGLMKADVRDNYSHTVYAGVDQNFLRNLTGSARVGATFIDYRHDEVNDDTWIPFAELNLSYGYATGSSLQVGFTHTFNQTDLIAPDLSGKTITSSQETSGLYALLNHRITSKLIGSLQGRYQYSTFQGGRFDDQTEEYFMAGVNLTYLINRHFSAEVGYNFDKLDSDASGTQYRMDYDRNRVYIGVTASY